MLNQEINLIKGLVTVWGNDYKLNKDDQAKDKYIANFKKLDKLYEEEYLNNIKPLMEKEQNIYDEQDRLKNLIDEYSKRLAKREEMANEYEKIINMLFYEFPKINLEEEIDEYNERLNVINKYLNNLNNLESLRDKNNVNNQELISLNEQLFKYEEENIYIENTLQEYFNKNFIINIIDTEDYEIRNKLSNVYDERIVRLERIVNSDEDDDIKEEKDEELSKIKFENFNLKNQLLLYDIEQILNEETNKYKEMYLKRKNILTLLQKRDYLIKQYSFKVYSDDYIEFIELINKQLNELKKQEEIINKIEKINKDVSNNINKIEKFELANNEQDIVKIRNEYQDNLIKEIKRPDDKLINEVLFDKKEENLETKEYKEVEEQLLKEEENLQNILKELDIKLNKIPSLDKERSLLDKKINKIIDEQEELNKEKQEEVIVKEDEKEPQKLTIITPESEISNEVKEEIIVPEERFVIEEIKDESIEENSDEIPNIEDVIKELQAQYPNDLKDETSPQMNKITEDFKETNYNNNILNNNFQEVLDTLSDKLDNEESQEFKDFPIENELDFLNGSLLDNIINTRNDFNEEDN